MACPYLRYVDSFPVIDLDLLCNKEKIKTVYFGCEFDIAKVLVA